MLCKREREEKDRRSQEGIDAHDSQRGFGTLRSTFTTFGAYLEEYGEVDNPFSSGRHAIAMSTTDEEASPRPAGGGGAQRSMKSSSGLHKEAPADTFTPSQQQGYWLARLSLGDEGFAVGSVPMCSSSHARGPRYAKWDAEKLVQALGSVCTPYSAQEEARPTPPPSAGSARCQSTVLRAVYGEHPTHPSNEASVLIDELDNVSNCGSDDDAGSCVSSTTAFSSESEEEQGGIVQDFSAFPEPLQGADDVEGTTISSDTSTSGSSYVYYSEGEPDYEEGPEDEDSRSDGVFGGGAFGDERGADPEHHSSVSNQSSSSSDSSTTSATFVPTVKRDPASATSLEQLENGEHAYLTGLRRTRKATLDAHRKTTRSKTKALREKLRARRAGVTAVTSGIKQTKNMTPECSKTTKKSIFTPLAQPSYTHKTPFGQSLSNRVMSQIKFARSALCLRLLAHDVLVLSTNREEKSIAKLIALRRGGTEMANYAKPSDRATDAIAAAALTSARSRAFAPAADRGEKAPQGPRDGPVSSIVDGLDYYTDHPAAASSTAADSDVAAYPPELNAELLLCKLPTVNDLSRVILNNSQPKPPRTTTATSDLDDELWDVDDFIEALQQVLLSRYIVSVHHQ